MSGVGLPPTTVDNVTLQQSVAGVVSVKAITNAQVDAAAAIAYTKLNLAGSVANADLAAGAIKKNLMAAIRNTTALGAATAYIAASGYFQVTAQNGALADFDQPCQVAGTLKNAKATLTVALGATSTIVITLMKNQVATAITMTFPINAAAESVQTDAVNTVAVAAGDTLCWRLVGTGVANGSLRIGVELDN